MYEETSYNSFKLITGVCLLVLIVLVIVCITSINDLEKRQKTLTLNQEITIEKLEQENLELKNKIQKLEVNDEITKKEFLQTWKSLAKMNNNMKALGLGYHLCPNDITPNSELDDDDN